MTARKPPEIATLAVEQGELKARQSWKKTLVAAFLAGAYIAFGGLLSITVSAGLDPARGARCRPCSPAPSSPSAWSSS